MDKQDTPDLLTNQSIIDFMNQNAEEIDNSDTENSLNKELQKSSKPNPHGDLTHLIEL